LRPKRRLLSLLFVLAIILSFATAEPSDLYGNGFNITVGDYWLKVQGSGKNLLFGRNADNQTNPYSVHFRKLQEVVRGTNAPIEGTTTHINSTWTVSNLTRIGMDGVKFVMSLSQANISFAFTIIFPNATNATNVNRTTCPADFCLKFDVNLTSYQWVNKTTNTSLGLVFSMQSPVQSPVQNTTQLKNSSLVSVADSFFSVVPTARVTNQFGNISRTVNVSITYISQKGDNEGIWVVYDGFPSNWTLFHDPAVGLGPASTGGVPDETPSLVVLIGLAVSAAVILVVVIIGVAILHKKQQDYEPIRS